MSATRAPSLLALALASPGLAVAKPAKHAARPIAAARKPRRAPARSARQGARRSARHLVGESDVGRFGRRSTTRAPGRRVTTTPNGTRVKSKAYSFGAMDVEGKLKTPQLLYFLNRVKLELDMSAPDKRSFMKELGQSADDKNL